MAPAEFRSAYLLEPEVPDVPDVPEVPEVPDEGGDSLAAPPAPVPPDDVPDDVPEDMPDDAPDEVSPLELLPELCPLPLLVLPWPLLPELSLPPPLLPSALDFRLRVVSLAICW